jgi:hypothetical protein
VTVVIKSLEDTQVGAIGASNTFAASRPDHLGESATNGAPATRPVASVDSTVQFIRAHYDALFRRLAD